MKARGRLVLVLGGANSGKSEFAEKLAREMGSFDLNALVWGKKMAYESLRMDFDRSMHYGLFASHAFRTESQSFDKGIAAFLETKS